MQPILKWSSCQSDGGYAVSDFRQIDERVGTLTHFAQKWLDGSFAKREILLRFMTSF